MQYQPLVDHELREFIANGLIERSHEGLVNPASLNLRIGEKAMIEVPEVDSLGYTTGSRMEQVILSDYSRSNPLWVDPGQFVMTDVMEVLRLPPDYEAQGILRSSAGRLGWDHAASLYVDPGYHGRLTLELVNCRRWKRLPLFPGQQLVQLRIYRLPNPPERDYSQTGRYFGATEVEANKDELIAL